MIRKNLIVEVYLFQDFIGWENPLIKMMKIGKL
jgi:hypothetical protein